jgi:hypothetical protein
MSDRQWHTFTVRFGTDGPLDVSGIPKTTALALAVKTGNAIREMLGTEQVLYVDDVSLFPDDALVVTWPRARE